MHGIQIHRIGGPEVLIVTELPERGPAAGELLVSVEAAGVNFIDTYQRSGLYPVPLPFTPGLEGAGTVLAVGPGVDGVAAGDLVTWADVLGSYAERLIVPAGRAVAVPDGVDAERAAAVMLQGITAHYLTHDSYHVGPGSRVLVHAGAGGVGLLLIQIAKHLGAEVFTTVGSQAKAELAVGAGADHVILYRDQDFVAGVEAICGPRPIDVVYDGVGRETFQQGLRVLRRRGTMVTFGNASGPVDPVSPLDLSANGSLFLTRPTLAHHIAGTQELRSRSAWVLDRVATGALSVRVGVRLKLAEAAEAHRLLEGRATTGKVLLSA